MKKFKIIMEIDDAKMAEVLKYMRVQTPWEKIKALYENWEDIFKENHFKNLGLADLHVLSAVFYFKGEEVEHCTNQFIYFLRNHQEFYNDNIVIVFQRMQSALEEFNTEALENGQKVVPFINWLPDFGGKITYKPIRNKAEYEWHKENDVPFALDGWRLTPEDETPKRKRGRPRKNCEEKSKDSLQ